MVVLETCVDIIIDAYNNKHNMCEIYCKIWTPIIINIKYG